MDKDVNSPGPGDPADGRLASQRPNTAGRLQPSSFESTAAAISYPLATGEKADWSRVWRVLERRWRLSAIFASTVMVVVTIVTISTKPTYSPSARLEIDPPGAEMFSLDDRGRLESGADYLETQARNIRSEELLISVIRQLHLDHASEFQSQGLLTTAIGEVFSIIAKPAAWFWGAGPARQPLTSSGDALVLSPAEGSTLRAIQQRLTVDRDTASRLVTISFTSHDPMMAATVTNAIAHAFIERDYQTRHDAIARSTEWLARQLDDIHEKMETSARALADFQHVSGITDVDQYKSTFTEQIAELSRQKTQAQADRIQLQSFLDLAHGDNFATLPQIQGNQVIQNLTQKLGEARAELAQTLAVYGTNHPNTRRLQNEVDELEAQVRLQQDAIIGELNTSYAAALAREGLINRHLQGKSKTLDQIQQYADLKKEVQANADLYNTLYSRVKEAGIAAASKSVNIRIVDQARVLDSPTRPQPLVNFGWGLCAAISGGVLLAFLQETFDRRIHTILDMSQSVGIPQVSILPLVDRNRHSPFDSFFAMLGANPRSNGVDGPSDFLLEGADSEQSEAFLGLQTSVMLSRPSHPPRLILVASSLPGEGKTTVAVNLAVALTHQGRTCILDADLRRPSVGRAFAVNAPLGLADFLTRSAPLKSILTPAPNVDKLTVIIAGKTATDPGRLMSLENARLLLRQLRESFDFVVIDSPPILPYSDGRALAHFVDGIVFVGRAGVVTREDMARSMDLLREVHSAPVLDVVLNGASVRDRSNGYGYRYGRSSRYE